LPVSRRCAGGSESGRQVPVTEDRRRRFRGNDPLRSLVAEVGRVGGQPAQRGRGRPNGPARVGFDAPIENSGWSRESSSPPFSGYGLDRAAAGWVCNRPEGPVVAAAKRARPSGGGVRPVKGVGSRGSARSLSSRLRREGFRRAGPSWRRGGIHVGGCSRCRSSGSAAYAFGGGGRRHLAAPSRGQNLRQTIHRGVGCWLAFGCQDAGGIVFFAVDR